MTVIPNIEFLPHNESSAGFELVELSSLYERSQELHHNPFSPHRVQFHSLIYITAGSGSHYLDFNRRPCREGSFIFINQNQVHAFDAENRPEGLMILFTQAFIDAIRINIRLPAFASGFYPDSSSPVLTVDGSLKDSGEALLKEIRSVSGTESHDRLVIQLLFAALMVKLHRERSGSGEDQLSEADHQVLANFLGLVETHYASTKDASTYADLMGVTYKTLNRVCKKSTAKSPKLLIDAHTILEAKRRLAIETIQVSQLAYELGFDDVSNFVKYFKKHTLLTPNDFLRSLES